MRTKDLARDDDEHPIPTKLRLAFRQISQAFADEDYELKDVATEEIERIDCETASIIADNIRDYGDPVITLSEETWERSRYRWMEGHWGGVVDLSTSNEPVSDLAIHFELRDKEGVRLKVTSVHVP